ncbi:PfkB family carbohydrate kinase [Mesorhizobium sp.]|uniref:PfkB family carbohydrate kinase n=1 Tax=Mesorhizobium sp. TaxID=1871066 RepID=UPI0025EAC857|nr:PfkB family carbohydrate kinase [Mesorhizobium sp.]
MVEEVSLPRPIVLSLGSINADLQFDVQGSLGVGGAVRASGFAQRAGGKAANVAYFTHRLGVPTRLIGRVGDDQFAEIAVGPLKAAELDLGSVGVNSDVPTGVAIVAVPKDGTKAILSASNANMSWNNAAVDNVVAAIRNSPDRSILVADFEIPLPVLNAAFETAQERGFRVLVDPTFADQIDRSQLCRFCAITPNQQEASDLLGLPIATNDDAARAALQLNALGVEIACVKLEDGGCFLALDHDAMQILAPPVDVIDKTGAGDAFIAAMAVALLDGKSAYAAACWGVAASAIAVRKKGAQESYPSMMELQQMIGSVERCNGRELV